MRKPKEIELTILSIKKDLETAPMYSMFGTNNHAIINIGINILEGRIDEDKLYSLEDAGEISEDERMGAMVYIDYLNHSVELDDLVFSPDSIVTASAVGVTVCKVICKECPFSNQSLRGWLSDYTIDDFQKYMAGEATFPCHMQIGRDDMTVEDAKEAVNRGEMTLCRGYVESVVKSAKMPYRNETLIEAIKLVKEGGMSEHSMDIFEFRTHHTPFKK